LTAKPYDFGLAGMLGRSLGATDGLGKIKGGMTLGLCLGFLWKAAQLEKPKFLKRTRFHSIS